MGIKGTGVGIGEVEVAGLCDGGRWDDTQKGIQGPKVQVNPYFSAELSMA